MSRGSYTSVRQRTIFLRVALIRQMHANQCGVLYARIGLMHRAANPGPDNRFEWCAVRISPADRMIHRRPCCCCYCVAADICKLSSLSAKVFVTDIGRDDWLTCSSASTVATNVKPLKFPRRQRQCKASCQRRQQLQQQAGSWIRQEEQRRCPWNQ